MKSVKNQNKRRKNKMGERIIKELILWAIVAVVLIIIFAVVGCATGGGTGSAVLDPPATDTVNGGLTLIRSVGLIGIGAIVFFALLNGKVPWFVAGGFGIGSTVGLAMMCRHYEKLVALIIAVGVGVGIVMLIASLFVKNKGIFLAWRKR